MPSNPAFNSCESRCESAFRRLFIEQFGDCGFGIAFDDEPFFDWAALAFQLLWVSFYCHVAVQLSTRFPAVASKVPQPGIGPGRPEWARDCKSRLSASSSTGAHNEALNAGTVMPVTDSPVLALFGPFSAALTPSSLSVLLKCLNENPSKLLFLASFCLPDHVPVQRSLLRLGSRLRSSELYFCHLLRGGSSVFFDSTFHVNQHSRLHHAEVGSRVVCQCAFYLRNPFVAKYLTVLVFVCFYFALLLKSFQAIVNRRERLAVLVELKSEVRQANAYLRGGYGNVSVLSEYHTDAVRELYFLLSGFAFYECGDFDIGWVFVFIGADRSQTIDQLFPLNDLRVYRRTLFVDFGPGGDEFIELLSCDRERFYEWVFHRTKLCH
jgi:hypothetical protein